MKKTGAQILIAELKQKGVDRLFGYPGGSILSVYDELRADGTINHVLAVDERGAAFMADGYARSSGKTGVCLATSGPGATNLVTGIASAFMDSVPMVIITGNVSVDTLGHDSFQEVDTTGITMPVTKYNYIVKDVNNLSYVVSEAFALAESGRKGPVLVDVPFNVFEESCEYAHTDVTVKKLSFLNEDEIAVAAEIIDGAEKPLIYVGGGVCQSETADYAVKLAKKLNAPVGVSLMGIGGVPAGLENYIGVGTSVNTVAKEALKECDVFISLGARFSNKVTEKYLYNKKVKLVHLDIDCAEIDKIHLTAGAVRGDLKDTLPLLLERVQAKQNKAWLNSVLEKKGRAKKHTGSHEKYVKIINNHFGNGQIVATDVGQHQLWVANFYGFDSPRLLLSSSGLGAMGYGLGAAIGAYFATQKPVVLITGDGSFNMSFNELLTAKTYGVPLTVFIMNNSSLGMIREEQDRRFSARYVDCDLPYSVGYGLLSAAYGADYYKISTPAELERQLQNYTEGNLCVFELAVDKNEKSL